MLVLPDQLTIRQAADAFGDDGELRDEPQTRRAEALGRGLAELLLKLRTG